MLTAAGTSVPQVENLFDALCSCLELASNQHLFLKAEGIELMLLALKEGRYASRGSLKALAAALSANGANCERFVDIRGFKTLFPLLGGGPPPPPPFAKSRGEREAAQRAHDEHVLSIVATLFHHLTDERRQRLLGKFAEEELAKLTRLLGIRGAYEARVAAAEAAANAELDEEEAAGGGADDNDDERPSAEDRIYMARVDGGLHTLHLAETVVGYLAASRVKQLRGAVLHGLYAQGRSLHDVHASIDEYRKVGGSARERSDKARERAFGAMGSEVEALLKKYAPAAAEAAAMGDGAAQGADAAAGGAAEP